MWPKFAKLSPRGNFTKKFFKVRIEFLSSIFHKKYMRYIFQSMTVVLVLSLLLPGQPAFWKKFLISLHPLGFSVFFVVEVVFFFFGLGSSSVGTICSKKLPKSLLLSEHNTVPRPFADNVESTYDLWCFQEWSQWLGKVFKTSLEKRWSSILCSC